MRMRKKKHGDERILACAELLIEAPETLKDDPKKPFADKEKLLCLEIGCGKGNFAVGTTANEHDINLIAMERVRDVCCLALEKAMAQRFILDNLEAVVATEAKKGKSYEAATNDSEDNDD